MTQNEHIESWQHSLGIIPGCRPDTPAIIPTPQPPLWSCRNNSSRVTREKRDKIGRQFLGKWSQQHYRSAKPALRHILDLLPLRTCSQVLRPQPSRTPVLERRRCLRLAYV